MALGALTLAFWGLPAWARACPVCFAAKDEANRIAFFVSTVFLTALPLVLMGAFIGWIARRARALEAEATADLPRPADSSSDAQARAHGLPLPR